MTSPESTNPRPRHFLRKPVEVEAEQFLGWGTLTDIWRWLGTFTNAFFVPVGYEHYMRTDHEKDRSRGDTLGGSPSYLVLNVGGKPTRVDEGKWIVRETEGLLILTTKELEERYDLKAGEANWGLSK
jgi:hypothetical protein